MTIDMACLERQGTDTASQGSVLAAERVQARLVVLCGRGSVDPSMAACLEGSSLVFDGRLVVDGAFRTNDSTVYGAGPLARFSSRYGEGINMDYMCSLEVGGHLARSLRSHFR